MVLKDVSKTLVSMQIEFAGMKVKSGIWGLIGSALPVIGGLAYLALTK
jgi:hypothetical protein